MKDSMLRFPFLILSLIFATIISFLMIFFGGWISRYGKFGKAVFYAWSYLVIYISGVRIRVHGKENYDFKKGYILAPNHTHLYDIPALVVGTKLNMKFLAKKELFYIPFFGWTMWMLGMISIDRGNTQKSVESIKKAQNVIEDYGVTLTVFPEGTRSRTGKLGVFKKGAFMTSYNTNTPLLPVTINGANKILKGFYIMPRFIDIYIHKPLDPKDYVGKREQFMADAREKIHSVYE
jgi:1-acyl-sn-glycerol-3-phosphate acyltransferase